MKKYLILGSVIILFLSLPVSCTIPDTESEQLEAGDRAVAQEQNQNLDRLFPPDAALERVAEGFKFIEGPVWHPDGFLLFSDIPADTIYQWEPNGELTVFRQPSGKANGNALDDQNRLITGEHDNRRVSRTEADGVIITLADRYNGKRLNSPNDLALHSDGSIYFTDPPYGIKSEQEELGFYGIYRLAPDGELTLLNDEMIRPNGITFSPDETQLYVNDSQEGYIQVFDVGEDGTLANGRRFAELKDPDLSGVPDGMKVDNEGNVYSTGPGGVWIFSPDGERLGIIQVPETAANLAWGDRDRRTLYITATSGLYRIRLNGE